MLVYFAVILTVLLGFCGLALDTGSIELRALQLQSAADAGALGVATEIANGNSNAQPAAISDVALYESLNGLPSTAPNSPYLSGAWMSDYSTVTVTLQQSLPTIFIGLLSNANANVSMAMQATAMFPPCMFLLGNPNLNMGFNTLNTQSYEVASANVIPPLGCPVYAANGVSIDYFAGLYGAQLKVTGAASGSYYSGSYTYPPVYGAPVMSDPLAYLAPPTPGACANASPLSYISSVALQPGTYCGKTTGLVTTPALSVTGNPSCTNNPVVTFSPGLYVFAGGIYLNCVTVAGTGVTMYFTNRSGIGFGSFAMYSSTWNVSAPTTSAGGSIAGIVLFGDRNWSGNNQDFIIMYSNWVGDGIVYVTNTGIYDYNTSMSAPNYFSVVAANMYTYYATVRPSMNYAALPAGNPLHTVITLVN